MSRVARMRIRSAWTHASGVVGAELDHEVAVGARRVDLVVAGSASIGRSCFGLRSASPYRSSNSDAPTPTVIVRWLGAGSGPRIRLSAGGSSGSRVRRRPAARSASAPPSSAPATCPASVRRSAATTSNAATIACAGAGVVMPAWCRPRTGRGRRPRAGAGDTSTRPRDLGRWRARAERRRAAEEPAARDVRGSAARREIGHCTSRPIVPEISASSSDRSGERRLQLVAVGSLTCS